jgi:AhpD family alkylhydroperoxidase
MTNSEETASLCSPAVEELIGISAAMAANCMPCLRYHVRKAESLGVSKPDMARAAAIGSAVKQVPAKEILDLAEHLVGARMDEAVKSQSSCSLEKAKSCSAGTCST